MLAKYALNHGAQLGAYSFPCGPVDGYISSHGFNQLTRDDAQVFITENFYRTIVNFQRVVESVRFNSSPRLEASRMSRARPTSSSITAAASIARFWYLRMAFCSFPRRGVTAPRSFAIAP